MSDRSDDAPEAALPSHRQFTANERAWIEFLRLITMESDPAPTLSRIQRLHTLFREEREPSSQLLQITGNVLEEQLDVPAERRNLAVLFDSENISARSVPGVLKKVAELGMPVIARCYGNFTNSRLRSWRNPILHHGLEPRQQFTSVAGKNTADIAMVLDAMDLLHQRSVDGFCLVTSDSDLAPLARRIRANGLLVYGFGSPSTPMSFRLACSHFTFLNDLQQPPHQSLDKAAEQIMAAMTAIKSEDEWVPLTTLGMKLRKLDPDWNPRSYGARKLVDLIGELDELFELNVFLPGAVHVRRKPGL